MRYTGGNFKIEFEEAFGPVADLTTQQLWVLVKMIKHCRLRCRSNAALYNYLRGNFPQHDFREVTKVDKEGNEYPGLSITNKTNIRDAYQPKSEEE